LKVLNLVGNRSVKLLQNTVYDTTQHPPTPHSHTLSVYIGKGGGEVREKVEGQQFTKQVKTTNKTECISSP
jgi:hypothetical protein